MTRSRGFLLAALLAFSSAIPMAAGSDRSPLVRLNQYYVLYSHPVAPFAVDDGVVMGPLRIFADLLGLRTAFSSGGRFALVRRGDVLPSLTSPGIAFTAGSETAIINGRQVVLPAKPRWLETEFDLLVPLHTLAEVFGISATWDASRRILRLAHPAILRLPAVEFFEERLLQTAPTRDTDDVVPARFSIRRVDRDGVLSYRLEVALERIVASRGVPGKPTLYTLVAYEDAVSMGGWHLFTSVDLGSTPDPCRRETGGARCIEVFQVGGSPLRYVLGRVRVFP